MSVPHHFPLPPLPRATRQRQQEIWLRLVEAQLVHIGAAGPLTMPSVTGIALAADLLLQEFEERFLPVAEPS